MERFASPAAADADINRVALIYRVMPRSRRADCYHRQLVFDAARALYSTLGRVYQSDGRGCQPRRAPRHAASPRCTPMLAPPRRRRSQPTFSAAGEYRSIAGLMPRQAHSSRPVEHGDSFSQSGLESRRLRLRTYRGSRRDDYSPTRRVLETAAASNIVTGAPLFYQPTLPRDLRYDSAHAT